MADIDQAYRLLSPMLGAGAASVVFAIALLASGQNSTVTGTLAGQIVTEGFLNLSMPAWLQRIVTRGIAIVPAAIGAPHERSWQLRSGSQVGVTPPSPRPYACCSGIVRFTSSNVVLLDSW